MKTYGVILAALGLGVWPVMPAAADPAPLSETVAALTRYTGSTVFTIEYPQAWQVKRLTETEIELDSVPVATPALMSEIYTQVQLLSENPDAVVNRSIDQFIADRSQVRLYRIVSVDGQAGFRIWMTGRAGDLTHAIATFVGYGDQQTALIFSQYAVDDAETEALILQVHDSFKNIEIAPAVSE
jgi:hypothetical protein